MSAPAWKDFVALPSNVGLTMWDAAPLMLGVAIAFAIIVNLFSQQIQGVIWRLRNALAPESLLLIGLGEPIYLLAFPLARGMLRVSERGDWMSIQPVPEAKLPKSPFSAALERAIEVLGSLVAGAIVVGCIDILVLPYIDVSSAIPIAVGGLVILAARFGPPAAAVYALEMSTGGYSAWIVFAVLTGTIYLEARRAIASGDVELAI